MASQFSEMAASAREVHQEFFAETAAATVTLPDASTTETSIVLHRSKTVSRRESDGSFNRITVRDARLPALTTIRHDVTITVGDDVYAIDEIGDLQASGLRVQLVRVKEHRKARGGYRGPGPANLSSR